MSGHAYGLVELLLVFGLVIGWALREIRSTARSLREDPRKSRDESDPPETG